MRWQKRPREASYRALGGSRDPPPGLSTASLVRARGLR
jgi:hypothetical protein